MKKQHKLGLIALLILIILFFYLKDEKVYVLEEYNSTGNLLGTNEYIIKHGDTVLQGKFVWYNEKGTKIAEGQFKENEPYGKCYYYYYNDGKIESISYRKNSKVDLESTYYNQNGSARKYVMCNDNGEPKFILEFENKIVKRYTGYVIYPLKQFKLENNNVIEITLTDTLKVGDLIRYEYLLANIPNTKRTFKIETQGIDNSKVKRKIFKSAPTRIIIEEFLTKKGLNRIRAITKYTFDDKVTPVKNDTVSFDVEVY